MSKVPRRNLSKRNPYYLPPYKAKEIFYFCLQYKDWKARLKEYKIDSSYGEWSNPTEKKP